MSNFKHILCGAAILPLAASCAQKQKPNIILFLVDDYGWADSEVPYGDSLYARHSIFHTPNMVRMAKAGVTFTNAYATPVSAPTRTCLMSGVLPAHSGITNYTSPMRDWPTDAIAGNQYAGLDTDTTRTFIHPEWAHNGLRPVAKAADGSWEPVGAGQKDIDHALTVRALPQILKDAGYYTIHVGKGHLGPMGTPAASPYGLGFDINVGGGPNGAAKTYQSSRYFGHRIGEKITNYNSVNDLQAYWGTGIDLTQALTFEALRAMDYPVDHKLPFFMYMSEYGVHNPLEADSLYYRKYVKAGLPKPVAKYASMVEAVDKSLGDIMDYLEQKGIARNTVVIFYSDNGGTEAKGPVHGQNLPLRSGKGSCYEGGWREPMIVQWPGHVAEGARVNTPVCANDFFPTILDLAGVRECELPQQTDGQSLVGLITRGSHYAAKNAGVWDWESPSQLYSTTHFTIPESVSGVDPRRPLIAHFPHQWEPVILPEIDFHSAIREGEWKLVYNMMNGALELYNLESDLGERCNVAPGHPEIVEKLARDLSSQLREWQSPMPVVRATGKAVPYPDELL